MNPALAMAMLENNWFILLAVRTSSYGCIWEVWRALKKLELLSAAPRDTLILLFSRALQISRVHPYDNSMNAG